MAWTTRMRRLSCSQIACAATASLLLTASCDLTGRPSSVGTKMEEDVVVPGASSYPESFRRDAVELVLSSPDRSLRQIALELGVSHETWRGWVRTARKQADPEQVSKAEQAGETRLLRKRLAELEKENEILRKAAAYFAREMDR